MTGVLVQVLTLSLIDTPVFSFVFFFIFSFHFLFRLKSSTRASIFQIISPFESISRFIFGFDPTGASSWHYIGERTRWRNCFRPAQGDLRHSFGFKGGSGCSLRGLLSFFRLNHPFLFICFSYFRQSWICAVMITRKGEKFFLFIEGTSAVWMRVEL